LVSECERNVFLLKGIPAGLENVNFEELLDEIIESYKNGEVNPEKEIQEQIAILMAKKGRLKTEETLSQDEMAMIVNKLFICKTPNYTPSGKTVISIISNEELEKRFR